jgi:hypothetical protein
MRSAKLTTLIAALISVGVLSVCSWTLPAEQQKNYLLVTGENNE